LDERRNNPLVDELDDKDKHSAKDNGAEEWAAGGERETAGRSHGELLSL
jgi:hypothetical protein